MGCSKKRVRDGKTSSSFLDKNSKTNVKKENKSNINNKNRKNKNIKDNEASSQSKINSKSKKKNANLNKKVKKFDNLHILTVNKVDNLIKEMESKKQSKRKKQSFFKNLLNLLQPNNSTFETPEFLSTPPFPEYIIDWKTDSVEMNLPTYTDDEFNIENDGLNTKMGQTEIFESNIENSELLDKKEDVDNSDISEMIIESTDETLILPKNRQKSKIKWLFTGIPGFDDLLVKGIPKGSNIIIAGGPGSGKTIFCLQTLYNKALDGKDCVFLSMEERPERLMDHLLEFGYKIAEIERGENQIIIRVDGKGRISLKRLQPIKLARSIEALLEKASGTLPIDIDLVLDFFPEDFDVCLLTLDSISAIETAFSGTRRQYRIYIEQLFRYFEHLDITTLMITESSNAPHQFSNTGVEEFLADGIFVFYNFQGVKRRTRGAEIYKLRGAAHSQKIVPMEITSKGIVINPEEVCREQA